MAIILAHSQPPEAISQLRNFDVPLMVLISGSVFTISSGARHDYLSYLSKRAKSLLIPTWIILCIYFLYFYVHSFVSGKPFPFSGSGIIESYALMRSPSGVGYVWIIRVFILVAATVPIFFNLYMKQKSRYLYLVATVYVAYEIVFFMYINSSFLTGNIYSSFIFDNIILYALPYGCVSTLGIYMAGASNRHMLCITLVFICLFIALAVHYDHTQMTRTQLFKYPPRAYYLSYALAISSCLYLFSRTRIFGACMSYRPVLFIGRSALCIYLWHILFIAVGEHLRVGQRDLVPAYVASYLFLVGAATCITYIQEKIVTRIVSARAIGEPLKRQMRELLLPSSKGGS